jgi:hypothetical protein
MDTDLGDRPRPTQQIVGWLFGFYFCRPSVDIAYQWSLLEIIVPSVFFSPFFQESCLDIVELGGVGHQGLYPFGRLGSGPLM